MPGITVDDLLARHPAWVAEIYGAVIEHLSSLGPIHEDAVNVGIFLKSDSKIAEFRPRVRSVLLSLYLPYEVTDASDCPYAADCCRSGRSHDQVDRALIKSMINFASG